jgi:hypothetical protein
VLQLIGPNEYESSGGNAQAVLSGLTIENGVAPTGLGALDPGWGGGIAVVDSGDSLVLNNVTVSNNAASRGAGGIDNFGRFWATNSTVTGNVLTDTGNTWSGGGGIVNEFSGSANLIGDSINHNTINGTGVGTGTLVTGGGMVNQGTLAVSGGFIGYNSVAIPASTDSTNPSEGDGGGLSVEGPTTLANETVVLNSLVPAPGAANVSSFGGGVNDNAGLATVADSTISYNTAKGDETVSGGGLAIRSGLVDITGTEFTHDAATVTNGTFGLSQAGGGGVSTLAVGSVALDSSTITNNTTSAETSDSTTTGQTVGAGGGGLLVLAGTSTINATKIEGNIVGMGNDTSEGYGAGVFALNPAVGGLIIQHSLVEGNVAESGFGGGILSVNTGSTSVLDDNIIGNGTTSSAVIPGVGGGLFGFGAVSIRNTNIEQNHATAMGGGLVESNGGILTGDTVSNNFSHIGAGMYVESLGAGNPTQVVNSTFTGNDATVAGGGIALTGDTSIDLDYSTVTGNQIFYGGAGGGLALDPSSTAIYNLTGSIVSGNTDNAGTDCSGAMSTSTVTTHGYNLLGDGCTATPAPTDLIGVDPMLAPLADNGGPTQTVALHPGSPAINAGGGPTCPATDQRGVSRPQENACDIGAFESTFSGYWEVASDGGIFTFGDATFFGSMGGRPLNKPVVGMASTPDGQGYWEVASDGGIFTFGDAGFFGSKGGQPLNKPIVGMAAAPDGFGYWLVGADGAVYDFGMGAGFYGDATGHSLKKPIVGIASTPDGKGYWLTAANGAVYAFGDAASHGDLSNQVLNAPVRAMAGTRSGHGYTLAAADGGIFTFGDAGFFGSMGGQPLNAPVTGIGTTNDGQGYWLFAKDGGVFSFGDAQFRGSMGGQPLNQPVVGGTTPG